ncbi:bifunctional adenosylcobinamide kinase/adenosylcobinamide-phosphate guanylyltransferase [Conexibacter stalactiti]|uniref:Aminotransferase n=1 Tax=Conexibacter stalactiti TaxID=1940611 RepID=A0ABU4HV67_9ACTN|nr:bifunctional adenosylcobinamide kinase/adenosylcobinamide-phosphate guanylyltransferase [Conexibacter stalactiti]MDW5597211.1 bifunctional adenosylcobinamide kinase/adenosylcobinamide-phosphate guanylyltransferase [Conexibacter stalactiti]MEC5037853.1 bifunctional adenosylcobinamide kinase/adenosylcobinamide-phosphate guanylyltransferase [Conexibacter stalactiti]
MTFALLLGGTRSGKSARAEAIATATGLPVRYVATADGSDPSLSGRIAAHVARRPGTWETIEAGERLADAVGEPSARCVLVDGLGPWIATALHRAGAFDDPSATRLAGVEETILGQIEQLVSTAATVVAAGGAVIVVAEQAGEGVLPPDRTSRAWLDLLGSATQRIAAAADRVELIVAGRPLTLADASAQAAPASAQAALGSAQAAPALAQAAPASAQAAPDLSALRTHGDTAVRPGDADHAVNVRAEGPPPWLREALQAALDGDATRYPDERAACAALAALHGREPEEIVPANGAAQALWLLPAALRPRLAACVHPGFTEAEAALRAHGVEVVRVLRDPARDFALDPAAVPAAADLVVVGNPASPSGTLDPAAALLALRRPGRVIAVDEAFMDLVPGEPGSLAGERLDDVIVLRSLTKSLAIPGLRAGYAIAPPAIAERLRAVRPPWSVNALALAALSALAARPDALAAAAERTRVEREDLQRRLAAIDGLRSWPAAANYCLVEVADGAAVAAALRERRIAVRQAASFPGLDGRHLRLTARTPDENERLALALAEAVGA